MTDAKSIALKAAGILWLVWGFVHVLAGVIIISAPDAASAVQAVADADPEQNLAFEAHSAERMGLVQRSGQRHLVG